MEGIRFEFYQIEKTMMTSYYVTGLYALTADGSIEEILNQVELFIKHGVKWVQFRDKNRDKDAIRDIANRIVALAEGTDTKIIINDYPDIAMEVGAHGVHVGQDDLNVEAVKKQYPELLIGVSTHNKDQFDEAVTHSPDYIALGPIFDTKTKENPEPCEGTSFAKYARKSTQIPLVGIGGIDKTNIKEVIDIGIDSVAMIASIKEEASLKEILSML